MAIVLSCECGRKLQINEEFAGQEGQCPSCGRTMLITAPEEAAVMTGPVATAVPVADVTTEPNRAPAPADNPPSPKETLTDHGGGALPDNSDFFAAAPEEIGPVLSAHTTLTTAKQPWNAGARLIVIGISGLIGLAIGSVAVYLIGPLQDIWYAIHPTVGSVGGVTIAFFRTRFSHACTYVGRDGVAKYTCAGNRDRIVRAEVFCFRDAAELRTGQTRRYVNGAYTGTTYFFNWTDVGGRNRHSINGTYRSAAGTPPATDPYQFGRAAEMAWTGYLLAQTQRQIDVAGSVVFNLKSGQLIRLLPGIIILQLGGQPIEWAANEIDAVVVEMGVVKIKRADAKEGWFSATGVVKFPFDSLANARLFFLLVNKWLGVRIG